MMAGPLVATCLGTPSNSIIVSRVPVGQKNLKRLVSAIETENLKKSQNRGSSCKLQSKLKTSKTSKISNALSARLKLENVKNLKAASCASCAFLRSPGDILNCSICLMPVFGLDMYIDFGLPKVVLPSSAHGCLCHPFWLLWSHYSGELLKQLEVF